MKDRIQHHRTPAAPGLTTAALAAGFAPRPEPTPVILGYGVQCPDGQVVSCDSADTARELVGEFPHLKVARREASGWLVEETPDDTLALAVAVGVMR